MEAKEPVLREYLRVSQDRSGTGKSPAQQHDEMATAARQKGWALHPRPYRDTDRSASRYARKAREGFAELMADLEDGTFDADMLGIWESSRGSRRTGEWIDLIEYCADRSVLIWVMTHNRVYDPRNARDRRSLREDASDAEYESDKTSERLLRDMRANAMKGRPHGKNIYGYERVYDQVTRQLIEVVEHPEHGPIVREAANRVLAGETYYGIAKDFNARGIQPRRPTFTQRRSVLGWTPPAIKQMLSMPAYAGLRQHQGKVLEDVEAVWPPLLKPEEWHRLQAVMAGRSRQKVNSWPAKHLLGGIAECGVCGAGMRVSKQNTGPQQYDKETGEKLPRKHYSIYLCQGTPGKTGFHVAMREGHLDQVVTAVVLARIQRPDFLARVGQEGDGIDEVRQALLEEIRGHREWIEQVRERAEAERNLSLLFDQENRVAPKIEAAQKRLESLAATDPLIVDLAGADDVEARWEELSLVEKRHAIRLLVTPRVHTVSADWRGKRGINRERVEFVWR
ncbi:resolvase, N terminal domain protein [Pseudarthrobacter siccitolerans]|uniref:Resolvase, N terminal domain protein n=1 Tax=Pseudarthrobacter siccitolerans TaxID=861266 RepID=A0A024H224_9MICC|nr:recombinase family protein [Pseudarthrobacter siccitolerans]CCQ46033.1 resolvase, N terminal domain protein [Pseudarthrobacter siccitolerans]